MITEDYVRFETAKLLREKGFSSNDCHYFYDRSGKTYMYGDYSKDIHVCADKPTQQMVLKWLRVNHNIDIVIFHEKLEKNCYWARVERHPYTEYQQDPTYSTYEESCEDAIIYCLEKMVETPPEKDENIEWRKGYPKPHIPVLLLRFGNVVEEGEYCGNDSGNAWYQYRWGNFIGDSEVTAWMPKQCLSYLDKPKEYERINEIHEQN
jgi:hypothetical protein